MQFIQSESVHGVIITQEHTDVCACIQLQERVIQEPWQAGYGGP